MKRAIKASTRIFLIPAMYFVVATAWIWITDMILGHYAGRLSPEWVQFVAILKGVTFVALTSLLLSLLMNRYVVKILKSNESSRRVLRKINYINNKNRHSANELDAIFNNSLVGIIFVDSGLTIRRVNTYFCGIMGYPADHFIDRNVACLEEMEGISGVDLSAHIQECKTTGRNVEVEFEAEFAGNGRKWLQMSLTKIKAVGRMNGFVVVVRDVTARKINEERIAYLSYYDFLTSLPNRRFFYEKLSDTLKSARRYGFSFGVLYMDINNFKMYNDVHGHEFGDGVLKEFARVVGGCLRESDILARLGGDEFAVLVGHGENPVDYTAIIHKVSCRLAKVEEIGGVAVGLSASIGLGVFPGDGEDVDSLLSVADRNMYVDKDRCRMVQAVQ